FDCGGRIKGTIKRDLGCVELSVTHTEHIRVDSERQTLRESVPQEVIDYITEESNTLHAADVYHNVVTRFPAHDITCMQVYYWWGVSFQDQYRLHDDQVVSSRMLLERHRENGFHE
ncbi:hypothetical protein BJV82DRAFT_490761, partial [Fennellomyces sp. T-0311]